MTETTPNHTQTVAGWAAHDSSGKITPYTFKRRANGVDDVTIKIMYCGICHTDLHFIKNDWGVTMYPIIPGHEITGIVSKVGSNVEKFKVGDRVAVGCYAASCLVCDLCTSQQQNYCDNFQFTYNGVFWDGSITYGGYSQMIVMDYRFVVHMPGNLPMDAAAPLLCAGSTVYCAMKDSGYLEESEQKRIGVGGLGGLGHVAVKIAKAIGHRVTVISTSASKRDEAIERLGADDFILSTSPEQMQAGRRSLDFVLDTVSANHSLGPLLELLDVGGTLSVVGVPAMPLDFNAFAFVTGKKTIKGNASAGIKETQEMLDFCGKHNITCDIEMVKPNQLNDAIERLARNDVRYRFVIDIAGTFTASSL